MSTAADIASLTISTSAGGIYEYHGQLLVSATTSQPYRVNLTGTGLGVIGGRAMGAISIANGANGMISTIGAGGYWNASGQVFSATVGATAGIRPVFVDGIINASANGLIILQAATSTGQLMAVLPGSYVRAYKVG
jgi:hypothetical protein